MMREMNVKNNMVYGVMGLAMTPENKENVEAHGFINKVGELVAIDQFMLERKIVTEIRATGIEMQKFNRDMGVSIGNGVIKKESLLFDWVLCPYGRTVTEDQFNAVVKASQKFNDFLLVVETTEEAREDINLNDLRDFIKMDKIQVNKKAVYNLDEVTELLEEVEDKIKSVKIYYDETKVQLDGKLGMATLFDIKTGRDRTNNKYEYFRDELEFNKADLEARCLEIEDMYGAVVGNEAKEKEFNKKYKNEYDSHQEEIRKIILKLK